ncbi:MAG: hypothetical protein JWQ38_2703 [Flavipsychrobacter sp.]|nr:hypothetical protein [Flavipsychrobacter sp.]
MAENSSLKKAAQITPILLAIMLIGSLVFYKESMLFSDCSHNIFRIINHDHLEIEASRYGIFISQVFPLTAARLHLPLQIVMMSYAASFYVFYLVVALLLVYKYKNYGLAILLGLYESLLVSDSYYYLNNEGIAWLLLVLGMNFFIAACNRPPFILYFVFIPTIFFALWTHPLVMMAGAYLWFFLMADKEKWPYTKVQTWILTAILLVLSLWKFYEGMKHGYDSTKIESLTTFQPKRILTVYNAPQFHFFIKSCITNYWAFALIFIAGLIALLKEKKYWLTFITLGAAGAYFILLCITYWDTESRRFYMEIEYMPLTIITSAAFVYFLLPKLTPKISMGIIIAVYLVRLAYMHHAIKPFEERLALVERMNTKMKEKNITKVLLTNPTDDAGKTLIMTWGSPVESILLSKLNGEEPQRTFMFMDQGEMIGFDTTMRNTMAGCWEAWTPVKLNHHYFNIDTTTTYRVMTYSELMQ